MVPSRPGHDMHEVAEDGAAGPSAKLGLQGDADQSRWKKSDQFTEDEGDDPPVPKAPVSFVHGPDGWTGRWHRPAAGMLSRPRWQGRPVP